jgi:hypothetical protein
MSNHKTRIVGGDGGWQARCECYDHSPICEHRWEADDWKRAHLDAVARVRAHLKKSPSLRDQRDWYRKQAAKATDEQARALWLMLAEGLDHRLGHPQHDDALF